MRRERVNDDKNAGHSTDEHHVKIAKGLLVNFSVHPTLVHFLTLCRFSETFSRNSTYVVLNLPYPYSSDLAPLVF